MLHAELWWGSVCAWLDWAWTTAKGLDTSLTPPGGQLGMLSHGNNKHSYECQGRRSAHNWPCCSPVTIFRAFNFLPFHLASFMTQWSETRWPLQRQFGACSCFLSRSSLSSHFRSFFLIMYDFVSLFGIRFHFCLVNINLDCFDLLRWRNDRCANLKRFIWHFAPFS